jgi:hypothetical protein
MVYPEQLLTKESLYREFGFVKSSGNINSLFPINPPPGIGEGGVKFGTGTAEKSGSDPYLSIINILGIEMIHPVNRVDPVENIPVCVTGLASR